MNGNPQLRRAYERERPGSGISNKDLKIHEETLNQKAMDDKIKDAKNKILKGEYKLEIRKQKQQEHILGTKKWIARAKKSIGESRPPQGAFYKDVDIQELINEYRGAGTIIFKGKDAYPRECVDVDSSIGIGFSRKKGKYLKTNRIAIHYSKNGVHAYPVLKKGKDV